MNTSKSAFDKVEATVTKINEIVLLIAISVMFILVFANVIGRYFFSYSISWATEISRYLMISGAFLGMGLAMKESRHSSFNIFQDALPSLYRRFIRIVVALIILVLMFLLLILGAQYAMLFMKNPTEVLRWPVGYWYMTVPVGAFLFIFHFMCGLRDYINKKKDEDLEAEINANSELVEDSIFLQSNLDFEEEDIEEKEDLR